MTSVKITGLIPIFLLTIFVFLFYINPFVQFYYHGTREEIVFNEMDIIYTSLFITLLLVLTPIAWLHFIDNMKVKEILEYLKFRRENLGLTIIYGVIVFFVIVFVNVLFATMIKFFGIETKNPVAHNIAKALSLHSIIFVAMIQSTSEEIFFRGFLMEKLSINKKIYIGITTSSLLFGLAHLSYNQVYQIVLPTIMGIIFGYAVVKTKNLFASIIPHVIYNLTSFLTAHFFSLTL